MAAAAAAAAGGNDTNEANVAEGGQHAPSSEDELKDEVAQMQDKAEEEVDAGDENNQRPAQLQPQQVM
eukprot:jgi/Chlat1/326/Chrsp1S03070